MDFAGRKKKSRELQSCVRLLSDRYQRSGQDYVPRFVIQSRVQKGGHISGHGGQVHTLRRTRVPNLVRLVIPEYVTVVRG